MTRTILNATQQADIARALEIAATACEADAAKMEIARHPLTTDYRQAANKCYELRALFLDASAVELVTL